MNGLFASSFAGFGILAEIRSGALERMRVTPISRISLLAGKISYNILQLLIQSLILNVTGLPPWFRSGVQSKPGPQNAG